MFRKLGLRLGTQEMSCVEHPERLAQDTKNALLETRGMPCTEHKECPAWKNRNDKERPAWNTWKIMMENDKSFPLMPMSNCD